MDMSSDFVKAVSYRARLSQEPRICHSEGALAATEESLAPNWRCFAESILSEAEELSMTCQNLSSFLEKTISYRARLSRKLRILDKLRNVFTIR